MLIRFGKESGVRRVEIGRLNSTLSSAFFVAAVLALSSVANAIFGSRDSLFPLFPSACADGVSEEKSPVDSLNSLSKDHFRIGTLNCEWANDEVGKAGRGQEDIEAIASIISESLVQLLLVQELENQQAGDLIVEPLNRDQPRRFQCRVNDTSSSLDLGVIWDSRAVSVENVRPLLEMSTETAKFIRPPITGTFTAGNTVGGFVGVHLMYPHNKEQQVILDAVVRRVFEWMDEYLADPRNNRNLIVGGDWNLSSGSVRRVLRKRPYTVFAPRTSTLVSGNGVVDFFVVPADRSRLFVRSSIRVILSPLQELKVRQISDHRLVVADLQKESTSQ